MDEQGVACPRCGHIDSFGEGFLPETCICRVCQSQLDWREVPGLGPDCRPLKVPEAQGQTPGVPPPAGPAEGVDGSDAGNV